MIFDAENTETNQITNLPELGPHGYHGTIFFAKNWKIPTVSKANMIFILASADNRFIVMAVEDVGLIYYTTNSGISWAVTRKPGQYWFRLSYSPKNNTSFFALATIFASNTANENQHLMDKSWYSVSSDSNGNKLVLTGGSSMPMPVLGITYFPNQVMLSWSASFTNFVPQRISI